MSYNDGNSAIPQSVKKINILFNSKIVLSKTLHFILTDLGESNLQKDQFRFRSVKINLTHEREI